MQRGKNSIFATFAGHLGFLRKVVRDRAISSEFLTHRVVQQYSVPRGKISVFHHSWLPSWISAENEKLSISRKRYFFPCNARREIHTAAVVLFLYVYTFFVYNACKKKKNKKKLNC